MIIYIWLRLLCGVVSFTGGGGEAIILACRRVQSSRGEDKGGFNKPAGTLPPPDWQTRFVWKSIARTRKMLFINKNTICSRPEPLTALEKIAQGTTDQRVIARTTMTSCDRTIPIVCQTAMWNAVMKMSAASILSIKTQHQHRRQQSHSNQVFKASVIRSSNNRTRVWYESTQTILKYIFEYFILLKCTVSVVVLPIYIIVE